MNQAGTLGVRPAFVVANQSSAVRNNLTPQPNGNDLSEEAFSHKAGGRFVAQNGDPNRMPINAQGSFINVAGADRAGVENVALDKGEGKPLKNLVQHRDHVTDGNVDPWRRDAQCQSDIPAPCRAQQMG